MAAPPPRPQPPDVDAETARPWLLPPVADHLSQGAAAFFGAVKAGVSIDVGVLERSKRVIVLAGDFAWDDVGTWSALQRVRRSDGAGNATHGRVVTREASGNVVHAEGAAAVLYGVKDLVVVVNQQLEQCLLLVSKLL